MYERPIPVSILAIDPGASSGYAFFLPKAGRWGVRAGSCAVWSAGPQSVVVDAHPSIAMVIERPPAGSNTKFLAMAFGLSEAVGAWRWVWLSRGGSKDRILSAGSRSWRAGILTGENRTTEEWKKAAIEYVEAVVGWQSSPWDLVVAGGLDQESADALCLGWWALHSPLLADLLGPRALAKLGWDDRAMCLEAKAARGKRRD